MNFPSFASLATSTPPNPRQLREWPGARPRDHRIETENREAVKGQKRGDGRSDAHEAMPGIRAPAHADDRKFREVDCHSQPSPVPGAPGLQLGFRRIRRRKGRHERRKDAMLTEPAFTETELA